MGDLSLKTTLGHVPALATMFPSSSAVSTRLENGVPVAPFSWGPWSGFTSIGLRMGS